MSEQPLSYEEASRLDDRPPQYRADFSQLYTQWKRTIEAASEADEIAIQLSLASEEAENATKVLKQLKERR